MERTNSLYQTLASLFAPDPLETFAREPDTTLTGKVAAAFAARVERTGWTDEAAVVSTLPVHLVEALRAWLHELREQSVTFDTGVQVRLALRPLRRLCAISLMPDVCGLLYELHWGRWATRLSRPQKHTVRGALALTLTSLPPDSLTPFWNALQSDDDRTRRAMHPGLDALRAAHRVAHFLYGLQIVHDHALRMEIVHCLEAIGEPSSLDALARLRLQAAHDDWPLARLIDRATQVIQHHNPTHQQRILLRASTRDADDRATLPRSVTVSPEDEAATLPRPASIP